MARPPEPGLERKSDAMSEKVFTIPEAAEALGCSPDEVRRMIDAGQLRARMRPTPLGEECIVDEADIADGSSDGPAPSGRLAALLSDMRARQEALMHRVSALESDRERRARIDEKLQDLIEREASSRTRAEIAETQAEKHESQTDALRAEIAELRRTIRHRNWAVEGLLFAIFLLVTTAWMLWRE